jgi:hypothetical protein
VISKLFTEGLGNIRFRTEEVRNLELNRGSNYRTFIDVLGKPVGGLHAGRSTARIV